MSLGKTCTSQTMSNNIRDTDVERVKSEVEALLVDLQNIRSRNEQPLDWEKQLSKRYKALVKTSQSLFKFILTQYGSPTFNVNSFRDTLDKMLVNIQRIQHGHISQHEASQHVGSHLAEKYIPQLQRK